MLAPGCLEWISANAVKSDEKVEWKKVSHHFIVAWNLCGEDVEEGSLQWIAWATKVMNAL